jgi:hypothetical protein
VKIKIETSKQDREALETRCGKLAAAFKAFSGANSARRNLEKQRSDISEQIDQLETSADAGDTAALQKLTGLREERASVDRRLTALPTSESQDSPQTIALQSEMRAAYKLAQSVCKPIEAELIAEAAKAFEPFYRTREWAKGMATQCDKVAAFRIATQMNPNALATAPAAKQLLAILDALQSGEVVINHGAQ